MRSYGSAVLAALQDGRAIEARRMVWITARDRETGAPEAVGFWEGHGNIEVSIGGAPRVYAGAGSVLDIEPVQSTLGLDVKMQVVRLSPISPQVREAVGLYDARLAPVEIHRGIFDPLSGVLLEEPHRIFAGWVDMIRIASGRSGFVEARLASSARALTRTLPLLRSDAAARAVDEDDDFWGYVETSGESNVRWGGVAVGGGGNSNSSGGGSGGRTSIWNR